MARPMLYTLNCPSSKISPLIKNEKHRLDLLIIFYKTAKAKKLLNRHKGILWVPYRSLKLMHRPQSLNFGQGSLFELTELSWLIFLKAEFWMIYISLFNCS